MTHFLKPSLDIWDSFFIVIPQTTNLPELQNMLLHFRDFRRIRKYLGPEAAKSVACALVTSHLDYCNSLLYNLPDRDIERLQGVQNCLALVVCKASRFTRSKPLLYFLHWLPVKYRIGYVLNSVPSLLKPSFFTNLHISLITKSHFKIQDCLDPPTQKC